MKASDKQIKWARFWKKFLRLTRGHVTVLRALEVIISEETDPHFKDILCSIRRALDEGCSFSESVLKQAPEFSPSVLELIRTAEKSGAWDQILQEIADGLEDGTFE
ncbi:type II secretion system F family protein [Verrucomicrobiota bacterium]